LSFVSLVHVEDSNPTSFKGAIERSLDLIQFSFERSPRNVTIKPNLCYCYDPSTGETTDPRFVAALIDVLREHLPSDPEISVVESDASAMRCEYAFKMLGYEDLAKEKGVTLVNLREERNQNVEVRIEDTYCRFRIPRTIQRSDLLVNVPKIKYMSGVKITCALKNLYGCNAYPGKSVYHTALDEAIVGINKLIKTDLVVADGIIAAGTATKRLGLVMASQDPVAIDAAACMIAGINPRSVRYLALASRAGIGTTHFTPKGESLSRFKKKFPRRNTRSKMIELLATVYHRYLGENANYGGL